ncbi:MAG: helix-turn-helix domain-containing protein [Streptosporangiaceae bacterium]|nr:helix-turn-helix domain-containing protein [Streptosporangiaceae bacterium]
MARAEKSIDATAGPLESFALGLRELRRAAGSPPYRVLSRQARYSPSTLAAAASGQRLPSLEVTRAYVAACDGDVRDWERRWRTVAAALAAVSPQEAAPVRPQRTARRVILAAIAIPIAIAVITAGIVIPDALGGNQPLRPDPAHRAAARPALPSAGGGFTAVTGPGCDETLTHNTDQYVPADRHPWRQGNGSGWTEDGCSGAFVYADTTGYADTWGNTFTWSFRPAPDGQVRCTLQIFVPDSPGLGFAQYFVYDRNMNEDDRIGSFSIDQSRDRGRWMTEGPYTSPDGTVQLNLTDLGLGHHNVAAGPVKVSCAP